jgi:hypothetical protein
MNTIENTQLVVSGPLHNNEPTGAEVVTYVKQQPIEGVLPYLVPHEALPGERFAGVSELGTHFPGNKNSDDPEDRVAAQMEEDLGPVADRLGVDIHDSPLKNANYIAVASATTPEQLALAVALELDKVVVVGNYPYFERFPRFISVETTRDPLNNPFSRPEYWHGQLKGIAEIGVGGLRRLFECQRGDLTYYAKTPIPLIGAHALTMAQVERLEHIPFSGETFEKVELPPDIAVTLGVSGKVTRVGTWGHMNNAKERSDLGVTNEGIQRREFFGSVFVEINAPIAASGATLQFAQNGQF